MRGQRPLSFEPGSRIPLEPGLTSHISREAALGGGEDYALLAAIPADRLERFRTGYPEHLPEWRQIGSLREPGVDGGPEGDLFDGFDHFA